MSPQGVTAYIRHTLSNYEELRKIGYNKSLSYASREVFTNEMKTFVNKCIRQAYPNLERLYYYYRDNGFSPPESLGRDVRVYRPQLEDNFEGPYPEE